MAVLRGIDGGLSFDNRATTEAAAAVEAWGFIAEAASRSLRVQGLSAEDVDALREIRLAACEICEEPPLVGVPSLAPPPRPGAA